MIPQDSRLFAVRLAMITARHIRIRTRFTPLDNQVGEFRIAPLNVCFIPGRRTRSISIQITGLKVRAAIVPAWAAELSSQKFVGGHR